ncbi:MAG: CopA family copper-resistance protein [Candidatus Endobugula sp.]|jgi:CopA family copper-resistance protein
MKTKHPSTILTSPTLTSPGLSRRRFVTGMAMGTAALGLGLHSSLSLGNALSSSDVKRLPPHVLRGKQFDLSIGYQTVNMTGKTKTATTVNGSLPAPTLRWKEGETVTLRVKNNLAHDSSIHWHGLILPSNMDGVPGLSFAGIKPGDTYEYQFEVNQSGTYWYHSHSGFQEQTGVYGAIVIDPKESDPVAYDRDHVVVLSDWSDETPENIYAKLKKMSHYYNRRERTAGDLWRDIKEKGVGNTWNERSMWNQMRMSETDIADVTGETYTFLMNGMTPDDGWKALFKKGEKVRLRFVNAAAMTIFDVRIPGLKMTVVASDGQNIEPVSIDEFRIAVAETYDVIVEPDGDSAYTIFAQSIDRTGFTRGVLTSDVSLEADIPAMDYAPTLGHGDMGMSMVGMDHGAHAGHSGMAAAGTAAVMDHSKMDHGAQASSDSMPQAGMDHSTMDHSGMNHETMNHEAMNHETMNHKPINNSTMDHSQMNHGEMNHDNMKKMDHSTMHSGTGKIDHSKMDHSMNHGGSSLGKAGYGTNSEVVHAKTEFGPHVDMRAEIMQNGISDPGVGLRDHQQRYGRKVLTYADIRNLTPTIDTREPEREIQLHLTGNMSRYMWSFNGINFADAEPLALKYGERVRIVLVNDTMMTHPIHLHGVWSELETGEPNYIPRKHTIMVHPGSSVSYLVTADAKGKWAYHCHLLYHMPGMMREVWIS